MLKRGANPAIKNSDGNIPSDMTNEPETKFLLDHFAEYMKIQKERGNDNTSHAEKMKNIQSPVGEYIRNKKTKSDYHVLQDVPPMRWTKLNKHKQ